MIIFPLRSVTYLKRHERIKPIAGQINALLPVRSAAFSQSTPTFSHISFMSRAPITYLTNLERIACGRALFFDSAQASTKIREQRALGVLTPKLLAHTPSYRNKESLLFAIDQ